MNFLDLLIRLLFIFCESGIFENYLYFFFGLAFLASVPRLLRVLITWR